VPATNPIPFRPRPVITPRPPSTIPARILPFRPATTKPPRRSPAARRSMAGQATTEYALVLLAAAAIALLLLAWATRTGAIGELFDAVLDNITSKV
jgi:hypothetical protein